jgi:hypothetical protein
MGQKFAAYNAQGAIIGFYDSVDSPVPAGVTNVIAITQAQWQACVNSQPPYTVANGALVAPVPPTDAEILAAAQANQIAILSAACSASIVGGFPSTALGDVHTYPSKVTDQQNLASSVIAALLALNSAAPFVGGKVRAAGELVKDGASVYVCVAPGTSGNTAPAWPTVPGAIVNDGSAQWQLWTTPFWCADVDGNWAFVNHTIAQILQVGVDGKAAILAFMAKNQALAAAVASATTVAAVQAITW